MSCSVRWAASLAAPWAVFAGNAWGQSQRCPKDHIVSVGNVSPWEAARIELLWKELHGPGANGGDGPLGCPVGAIQEDAGGPLYVWKGVKQQFQRGWVLLGRGDFVLSEVAAVRGLGSWTLWSRGIPGKVVPTVGGVKSSDARVAAWSPGGEVFVTSTPNGGVSLLKCPGPEEYSGDSVSQHGCQQFTPVLDASARPFDAAAHLDERLLAVPSADGFEKRVDALFADWLPCHTPSPRLDDVGETSFAQAMILLRRDAPCPLSGKSPSDEAKAWLSTVAVPEDMLPGTSWDDCLSTRNGELDVTLVQILRLLSRYENVLPRLTIDRLQSIVDRWGVPARKNPYVQPNGDCLGFGAIETENHMLLQETAAYLINARAGRSTASNSDWLVKFLTQIARRDFYEFNSIPYSRYQSKALYLLHDIAPDARVRVAAQGLLDWLFAKAALSGNLDRDHRPFRRSFKDDHVWARDWWGSAATPLTTQASLFIGPLQHAHADIDLQLDEGRDKHSVEALTDPTRYPELGMAPEYVVEALVDAASTRYRLPEALVGWFERRFTSEESNRSTYVQAISHTPKAAEDPSIFAQAGSGAELVSGNRNWTMIAGGTPAPPGDPGPPPASSTLAYVAAGAGGGALVGAGIGAAVGGPLGAAVGGVIGGVIGGIIGAAAPSPVAADLQRNKLWETQAGTIRETTLIPTAVGMDRAQTLRFGRAMVTSGSPQLAQLCVAEGFMCGFDLRMPPHPFPDKGALQCPVSVSIPAALESAFLARSGGVPMNVILGCPLKGDAFLPASQWRIWTFENGMLALAEGDPPGQERFAGAWVEGRDDGKGGHLRVAWNIRGDGYDWFRVHAYTRPVSARGGEPPGGWIEPLPVVGDAGDRTKEVDGDTSIRIPPDADPAASWDILIVGCKKEYFLGIATGHDCVDDKMPRLTVDVGPLPRQTFACAVHPPPPVFTHHAFPSEGTVLEVGSCQGGPYGFLLYYWTKPCPPLRSIASTLRACPAGASDYGVVVVAPSRGFAPDEFRKIIERSMTQFRASGHDYVPGLPATIDVPIAPPVTANGKTWTPTAAPSFHSVSFGWPVIGTTSMFDDTGAPAFFPGLGSDPAKWPTAFGHVTAPDTVAPARVLHNNGNGCFTLAGFATPSDPDPVGLLVDLRDSAAPVVSNRRTSDLASLCP